MNKNKVNSLPVDSKESSELEQMIRRILSIDSEARDMTAKAENMKMLSEKTINEQKAKLRADYLERANNRIKLIEEQERVWAQESLESRREQYKKLMQEFDLKSEQNQEDWIKQIVERTVSV